MVGCGSVDLDHVFPLAYDAAEGALGTDPAEGLVSGLSMEFASTSVAASLGVLCGAEGSRRAGISGMRRPWVVDQWLTGWHELICRCFCCDRERTTSCRSHRSFQT